jgi:beta-glucanase (GH16 family)
MPNLTRSAFARREASVWLAFAVSFSAVLCGCTTASAKLRPQRAARSRPATATVAPPFGIPGHWHLVLNSTFNSKSLDTGLWRAGWFSSPLSGPINAHELACYSSSNATLAGTGTLNLALTHTPSTCGGVRRPYTGSIISTNPNDGRKSGGFTYTYGVAEARIYIPPYRGRIADWPAFATFGQHWPATGEDDIMEGISGTVCYRFHSEINPITGFGGCDPGIVPGWHTIASDWEPNSITWYCDGIDVYHETRGVTSAPMYLVLVNTVSAKWSQLASADTMKVAYVRVWQSNRAA